MHLVLGKTGALEAEFRNEVEITFLPATRTHFFGSVLDKILGWTGALAWLQRRNEAQQWQQFEANLRAQNIGLIFANTIASADIYQKLNFLTAPTVLFAHELAMSIAHYSRPEALANLLTNTDHLIVVSRAVAQHFSATYHFPAEKISTFQIIDMASILNRIEEGRKVNVRQKMGLPSNAILIGSCGNAEWRKGNDVFMAVAQQVIKRHANQPVYFVWVGMHHYNEIYQLQRLDAQKMGLADRIIHVESTPEVFEYLSQYDVFILPSREDPYPLVVLEAALAEKPIVCFAGAGGAPELVEADAGFVVSYLDVQEMSNRISQLIDNEDLKTKMGQIAKQKVLQRHPINESIDQVMAIVHSLTSKQQPAQ